MDEDVPELMEAMAEKVLAYGFCDELIRNAHCSIIIAYFFQNWFIFIVSTIKNPELVQWISNIIFQLEFVFEDLIPTISNAGEGILRNSAKRSRSRPRVNDWNVTANIIIFELLNIIL